MSRSGKTVALYAHHKAESVTRIHLAKLDEAVLKHIGAVALASAESVAAMRWSAAGSLYYVVVSGQRTELREVTCALRKAAIWDMSALKIDAWAGFSPGARSASMPWPRLGLGLAVSHALIEAMGGAIRVQNPEAGGARFEIELRWLKS